MSKKEGRRQAYRGVGDFGAAGNKRAAGKKEGRGPVRRPVSKKEGRWQAYRGVGDFWAVGNKKGRKQERGPWARTAYAGL